MLATIKLMVWWRKALLWISRFILRVAVLLAIVSAVFATFFNNPDTFQNIVAQSGAYQQIPNILIDEMSKLEEEENNIPVNDPEIRAILERAFSEDKLSEASETVLDSLHRWLRGETEKPDFVVDISDSKKIIVNGVSSYVVKRIDKLPPCTSQPKSTDPFEIDCRPPGFEPKKEAAKYKKQLLSNEDFLPDTKFTAEDIKNEQGEPLDFSQSPLPGAYSASQTLPKLLIILAVLAALAILFLDRTKLSGSKRVGRILLSTGGALFVLSLVFIWLLPKLSDSLTSRFRDGNGLEFLNYILTKTLENLNMLTLKYSGLVAALGALILLAIYITKGRGSKETIKPPKPSRNKNTAA